MTRLSSSPPSQRNETSVAVADPQTIEVSRHSTVDEEVSSGETNATAPQVTTTTTPQYNNNFDEESAQLPRCESNSHEDDDDALTFIGLDPGEWIRHNNNNNDDDDLPVAGLDPFLEQRRQMFLSGELERVQRASCILFFIVCLFPSVVLVILVFTLRGGDTDCYSPSSFCAAEPRNFMNAFTSRCVCDGILLSGQGPDDDLWQ